MMLKTIILDDEKLYIEELESLITANEDIQLLNSFTDAFEAIEFLKKESIDLIFLDIEMPKLSGFDFLEKINPVPLVIFVTSYEQYALKGYEFEPVNFITKPINEYSLLESIERAKLRKIGNNLVEDFVMVKTNNTLVKVFLKDILFIKADGDFIEIYTKEKRLTRLQTLKEFYKRLPKSFVKIHRSFIVNTSLILGFNGSEINIEEHKIPVSRAYKTMVMDLLVK